METPHLDKTIEQLKGLAERVPVKEVTEKLQEYKAIKEALIIHSVRGSFLCGHDQHGYRKCPEQCSECNQQEYCNDCGDYVGEGCDNEDCKDFKGNDR